MENITGENFELLNNNDDDVEKYQMDEEQFLVIQSVSNIDVLDEKLYCYDSPVFSLSPTIQNITSESLLYKVKQFIDSVPAIQKSIEYVQSKTEYIPRLDLIPEEIKQALQNGTAEIIPCKDFTDAFFLQIRATVKGLMINGKEYGKNRKIKDIPLGTKTIPADITGAMQCLSTQNQLTKSPTDLRKFQKPVNSILAE